jgi:hypothetical protein
MRSERQNRLKGSAAAALMGAQLLVLLLVPVLHQAELAASLSAHVQHVHEAGRADHTERPSSRSGHHETACHVCRVADVRYAASSSTVRLLDVLPARVALQPASRGAPVAAFLPGSPGPRAPPRS